MKILLFGAGRYYEKYKLWFRHECIVAIADNDEKKWGTYVDGVLIINPEVYHRYTFDRIYILSLHYRAISSQLLSLGIPADIIYNYLDIYRTLVRDKDLSWSKPLLTKGKTAALLVSHDLSLTGAPMALFHASKILKNNGYNVIVASPVDGPLRFNYEENGIDVSIDPYWNIAELNDYPFIKNFTFIMINTKMMWHLLRNYAEGCPVIWWLHEPKSLYHETDCIYLSAVSIQNVYCYAVSSIAANSFIKYRPKWNVDILPIGITDVNIISKCNQRKMSKLVFALIGTFYPIKAQNIFIDAIEMLQARGYQNCEFFLIGKAFDDNYSNNIKQRAISMPDVRIWGEIEHGKIHELFSDISVLVCASLEETFSIVAVEAMMHGVPCLVTETTGISEYITPYKDGLVCYAGSASKLADEMIWLMEHRDYLPQMGINARKIFETNFSYKILEKNILNILHGLK